jgi:hypothetical protein
MAAIHKATFDPNGNFLEIAEVQTSQLEQSPVYRALHKAFTEVMSKSMGFEVPITPQKDREPLRLRFNPQPVIGCASAWLYKEMDLYAVALMFAGGYQHEDAAVKAAQVFFKASADRTSQPVGKDLATLKWRPLVATISTMPLDEFESSFAADLQMALTVVFLEQTIWRREKSAN